MKGVLLLPRGNSKAKSTKLYGMARNCSRMIHRAESKKRWRNDRVSAVPCHPPVPKRDNKMRASSNIGTDVDDQAVDNGSEKVGK